MWLSMHLVVLQVQYVVQKFGWKHVVGTVESWSAMLLVENSAKVIFRASTFWHKNS